MQAVGHFVLTDLTFSEEFFYQLGLIQFGDYHRIKLDPPPPLRQLVALAVDVEDTSDSKLNKTKIVDVRIVSIAQQAMLMSVLHR